MDIQKKADNVTNMALWTGILSVVLAFGYYLIPIGLVLGVIAIISGHKARKLYYSDQEKISASTARNATLGWICGIAGLCISIFWGIWHLLPGAN